MPIKKASFQFYIEDAEDGDVFSNNVLIEEYITLPHVLEEVAEVTNTSIDQLVEETGNEIVPGTQSSDRIKVIHVNRDTSSNLQAIYVNVGDEQRNLRIINYFHDFIQDESIPFLEDKNVFIFKQPYIVDFDDEDETDLTQNVESISSWSPVRTIVEGIILGVVLSIVILVISGFFSRKLSYFFFYTLLDEDYFILMDKHLNNHEEVYDVLRNPFEKNTVVLQEKNIEPSNQEFESIFRDLVDKPSVAQVENFMSIASPKEVDQLVYIVKEGETSRDWYNKQRKVEKAYDIPVVVIQINQL